MSLLLSQVPTTITYTRKNGTKEVFLRYEELGHGGLATVFRVKHQSTNKIYAMKIISKQHLRSKGQFAVDKLKDEIRIQKKLNHPNILRSKLTFSDSLYYYIVLEYCPGQSIREYLKKSAKGYLSEAETKKILRDVIHGLIYLHKHKIVHHDLKLENFIIDSKGRVKISDFGLASVFKEEEEENDEDSQSLICGTINYLSPEIINREGNGFEADIWAVGVAAFIMLTGKPPFEGINKSIIFDKITKCEYHFPVQILLSPDAKKFIKEILQIKPYKRPTASDLLNYSFIAKIDKQQVMLYKPTQPILNDPFSKALQPNQVIQNVDPIIQQPQDILIQNNQKVSNLEPIQSLQKAPLPDSIQIDQPRSRYYSGLSDNKENLDINEKVKSILKKIHAKRHRHRAIHESTSSSEIDLDSQDSDESDNYHKKKNLHKGRNRSHSHKVHHSQKKKLLKFHKHKYQDSEIDLSD